MKEKNTKGSKTMNILAPSILAADFTKLGEEIIAIDKAGAGYIHIDVMDGMFVPSISFAMPVIKSIRKVTDKVFDVHLMIEDPDRFLKEFKECGADLITVQAEACTHLDRTLNVIRELGCKAGVALNPATPLCMIENVLHLADMVLIMSVNPGFGGQKYIDYSTEKIKNLRKMINDKNLNTDIQVDGGITTENVKEVIDAGANIIVAGTAVFKGDIEENVKKFLKVMA